MPEKENITPAEEVTQPEVQPEVTPETEQETIGDAIDDKPTIPNQIPYDRFKEVNDKNKALEAKLEQLQSKATDEGMSKGAISKDLQSLASEYDVDANFVTAMASIIKAEAQAGVEAKLKPLTDRETAQKVDIAIKRGYDKAIANLPDYADVVNEDIITQLAKLPQNKNKTFKQLIEDTYASSLKGRATIESTNPGGGNEPEPLDFVKAKQDGAYFAKIMANPKLKAEYNANMLKGMN